MPAITDVQPIRMNDFRRQWEETGQAALQAVAAVGESGHYILGGQVAELERALAAWCGRRWTVGCASGLDAIELCLRALDLPPGAKVLTTPLSAFATTLAIVRAGGVPVFVDVDESGLLDLSLVEERLRADGSATFLVPVHLYGHALDLARLEALRRRWGLRVVEDCAQAVGAKSRGLPVGSAAEASAISFYPTKNLGAIGDAGAVLTDDESVRERCRALRNYGQAGRYEHVVLGLNSRLDEIHAAMLLALLPRLAGWTARRRAIAERYRAGLDPRRAAPLPVPPGSESVWHLFPVLAPEGGRELLREHLRGQGIESLVHYPHLICEQPALQGVPHEVCGTLVVAQRLAQRELSLPIHPYLSDEEVERVIAGVNGWPC